MIICKKIGDTFAQSMVDNNQISTSVGGSSETNDRGYKKPNGAVKLGLHISNSRINGDKVQFLKSLFIYNIPYMQKSVYEQIEDVNKEVKNNKENMNLLSGRVTVLENNESTSYKDSLKILFIGSSFGVDTVPSA